jgi:hypothetical protein
VTKPDPIVVVAFRVADGQPHVPSAEERCRACGEAVFVDLRLMHDAAICFQCAALEGVGAEIPVEMPSSDQREWLRGEGMSDADIECAHARAVRALRLMLARSRRPT